MTKRLNINKGDKFNRLIIIKEVEKIGKQRAFKCKCICGNIKNIQLGHLRNNHIQSCGCLQLNKVTTHGMNTTKIYKVFTSMRARCNNPNTPEYKYYGLRGIKCERTCFEDFYKDMKDTYKEGLSIEREDNDGNYCKSNCSWKTRKEQMRNTRNNRLYKGKCIAEWINILGLNNTVYRRLHKGWTEKEALFGK